MIGHAWDPIVRAGLLDLLDARPEVELLPASAGNCEVIVLAAERVTAEVLSGMRKWATETSACMVVLTSDLSGADLLALVEYRIRAVLPFRSIDRDWLISTIGTVAAGAAVLPPALVGDLLQQLARLQQEVLAPHGLNAAGLSAREVEVIRLMAEGMENGEIARVLCYSDRTVSNIIQALTSRLGLRNRTHAVAYALRAGFI